MTPQEKKVIGFLVFMVLLGVLRMTFREKAVQTAEPMTVATPFSKK